MKDALKKLKRRNTPEASFHCYLSHLRGVELCFSAAESMSPWEGMARYLQHLCAQMAKHLPGYALP